LLEDRDGNLLVASVVYGALVEMDNTGSGVDAGHHHEVISEISVSRPVPDCFSVDYDDGLMACPQLSARIEGHVSIDEVLSRFPDWELDLPNAVFPSSSAVRGWDSMPHTSDIDRVSRLFLAGTG
jgi:hypothetical protein